MHIWSRLALLAAVLTVAGCGLSADSKDAAAGDPIEQYVAEQREAAGVPGVAYAIVSPTEIEHAGTLGKDGDGDAITDETPFLWGSVAKAATSTLFVKLAQADVLDLDAPVASYLPDFALRDRDASARVTVRHLLDQTAGIPPAYDLTDQYDPEDRAVDVLDALHDRDPVGEPGEKHVYSSTSYLVATALVEEVTGRRFADVLREYVLAPAGMDDAITTSDQARALAPGHRYVFGQAVPFDTRYAPTGAGYGYLGGDLHDAIALARTQLSESPILDADQRAAMQAGSIETGDDRTYGLGWRQWEIDGTDARKVWVSGASPGWLASVVVLPELDRAIVVLQNAYGTFQEPELLATARGLASLLYDEEPAEAGTDPMYVVALVVLGALVLGLAALAVRWAWRIARPDRPTATRRRLLVNLAASLAGLAALAAVYLALPRLNGISLGQFALWTPDLAWLVYVGLALTGVLIVMRIALTVRLSRCQVSSDLAEVELSKLE